MLQSTLFLLICNLDSVFSIVIPKATSTLAHGQQNDNAPPIPTFSFELGVDYIITKAADPEPSGASLQIYPTGIVDYVPKDGLNVSFGPDLRKRIKDTMVANCKDKSDDQCRNALVPVVHNTDVSIHSKRFVGLALALLPIILSEILIIAGGWIYLTNKEAPEEIHFPAGALEQINSINSASVIAIQTDVEGTASPLTITAHEPTSTLRDYVSVETLDADSSGHKKGDVVYHLPEQVAQRVQDFLGMMGAQEASKKCARTAKRVDVTDECLRLIAEFGRVFVDDDAPDALMQLNPANPVPPLAPDHLLHLPVQHLVVEEIEVVVLLGRQLQIVEEPVDLAAIARAALVVTVVAHALMYFGDKLVRIYIPQEDLAKELKEDDFKCPKDLICPDDDCQGQKDDEDIDETKAICLQGKYLMCKCQKVAQPYVYEVAHDYMDRQYAWLEELIGLAALAGDSPICDQGQQNIADSVDKFNEKVNEACKNHDELKKRGELAKRGGDWVWTSSGDGWTWGLVWADKGSCPFDCQTVFGKFSSNDTCFNSDGLQKHGVIDTTCGEASYQAYWSDHP